MRRVFNFFNRNLKEVLRDPIIYIFCLGFPLAMLALFQVIEKYSGGHTPTFALHSLLPGIIMFSYTFVMMTMSLLVSKDRQTFFLKRLYASPMKPYHFILGYSLVGLLVGVGQTAVCLLSGWIISLIKDIAFLSLGQIALLFVSQLPILIICVFLGVLLGTALNDKAAPGICSALISLAGILGGCWMPVETMGGFETFCRFLPFYPSVYFGRMAAGATDALGAAYTFHSVAVWGLVTIFLYAVLSILASFFTFKKDMTSDK